MVQTAPQFTPPQLLDSGRRAEAEGQLDLAAQFYRHLSEHYAYSAEAAEARSGLGRIGAAQNQIWHSNGSSRANGGGHASDSGHRAGPARAPRRRPVAPRDHYRIGRALALAFGILGWLMVAAGVAAPAVYVVPGTGLGSIGLWPIAGGAVGLLVLGFLVVLGGQAARALFDHANAARELVALERTKVSAD
jgi:hypothetical protein